MRQTYCCLIFDVMLCVYVIVRNIIIMIVLNLRFLVRTSVASMSNGKMFVNSLLFIVEH